jgi:pentatricopeptide repeat protein
MGMDRDAITYSALISALSKGRQWGMAIDVFNHMVAEGVECDAVTCCSLITALDKGGQWQLAEQVRAVFCVCSCCMFSAKGFEVPCCDVLQPDHCAGQGRASGSWGSS